MHGTERRVAPADFARLKYAITQARQVEKRRAQIYMRILAIVEEKVGQEALLNNCVIAKAVGISTNEAADFVNAQPPLARIICKHQRRHGASFTQRRKMQGPFVPCNP